MFNLKSKPKFSVIILALFILLFTITGIYIVLLMNAANPQPGSSKNLETLTQEVLGEARDLKNAKGEQKTQLAKKIKDTAKERKTVALSVMDTDPAAFLRVAVPKNLKTEALAEVAEEVEEEVVLEGELELEIDDLENGNYKKSYYLNTPKGERLRLHFAQKEPDAQTGTKIKVKGMRLADALAVDGATSSSFEITGTVTASMVTTKKVAALLFTFTDLPTAPQTRDYVKNLIFTNTNSSNAYYKEVSFGKIALEGQKDLTGDVYGWFQLPIAGADCNTTNFKTSALAEAQRLYGFSPTGYNNVLYIFPRVASCGFAGRASVGGAYAYINGSLSSTHTISHEMGHNYGNMHANGYNCTENGVRVTMGSICTNSEYSDPYDVMGSSPYIGHFNNFHKGRVGYWDIGNTLTVTNSGTYSVYPVEKNVGVTSLRIPIGNDASGRPLFYYIENRQAYGFDTYPSTNTVYKGVLVRVGNEYNSVIGTELLDATPATASFYDAALVAGQTFTDKARGITITPNLVAADKTIVNISLPAPAVVPCVKTNPTLSISPLGQYGTSGQALTYQLALKNNDSATCGTTTFNVTSALPSGFTQTPATLAEALAPGASVTKSIIVTSPTTAVNAAYPFTVTAKNSTATTYTAGVTANYNVYNSVVNPVVTPPVVTLTGITTGQVLTTTRVTVRANASDSTGISSITMYLDERRVASCASVNVCSYLINPRKLLTGSHVIKAVAVDKENQSNQSSITFYKN